MTQFKALSMESDGEDERGLDIRTRAVSSDSEEEVFTTQPRRYQYKDIICLASLLIDLNIWCSLSKMMKKKKS